MALEKLFPGEGEMARRMRDFDWPRSPLGGPREWPKSLATAVHICLTSRFPIVLWWGKDLRLLYNDAWRPVLGKTKHPGALGAPGREVWPEIWHIIGPMLEGVLAKGEATWSDDQLLPLERNGYLEEAYFTYSYSPIPDERGGVGGVFAAVNETTVRVLAERRLRTLRELAAQTLQAKGAVEAARMAMATLAANASDVPFALLYLVDPDGRARLERPSAAGLEATEGRWPVAEAIARGEPILLEDLQNRVGRLPSPWPVPPDRALVLPLRSAAQERVLAVLVLGVNPARELDEEHRGFLDLASHHIANSIANASAYEEERRRAEERREAEERLRAIVETTPECVKLVGRDGTLLQMNAAGLSMVGAPSAEAVLGRCIYDVIAPQDRARFREFNERICAGERGTLEFEIVGLGGVRRHMETHAVPLLQPGGGYAQLAITRDVTERRKAEQALRASEERYRGVLNLMPVAVYTCEAPSGVLTYYNEHAAALWGRRPTPGDREERFCGSYRLWLPDGTAMPHEQTPVAAAMREGRSFRNLEVVMERPDGSRVTVLVNIDPLRDDSGRISGVINVFHDITERRLAEQRLRRSEQELSNFFETASIGLHWVGPDGTILRANRAELEMLGYAPEEYIGHNIAEFHADRPVIDDILARLTRGERLSECPARMRCKDGSVRDVLINSSVLFEDGKFMHTRCFTLDVTARKRAEAGLQARARQQQSVAALGELALREHDLQKVFERSTVVVAETLGVEYCKVLELLPGGREVLLRAGVGWKEGLVGVGRVDTGMDSQAGYTLACGAPVVVRDLRTETRFRGPPLLIEHGVVSGMSCIIRGAEGEAWGVLGTHATRTLEFTEDDVSFLTAVANILGHAIQRERAEAALRDSDRRKDEFIAMLSHELRNPLAPLRSGLEILRLRPSVDQAPVREMMERQVNHLVRLVDDLLETSRISRGLVELRRDTVQLAEVLRSALEACQPLVREAGHRLEVDLPREPLWVRGDAVRLSQSFANLLNNAARYTPRGGSIWLRATREADGSVCVSVRDSGAGFPPQAKDRIFEMFSRGEGSSGLGIGLALVRRLVEMHGGTVEARSEGAGRGAEFIVRLPPAQAPAGAPRQRMIESAGRSYRVLVADDNRDAAETLAMLLRTLGNEVTVAYDGVDAVAAAREFRPHVVLLDIGMPRLDGYDAAREIRRQPSGERVRLVALTGWGQEEDRRRAREAGFDTHLVKPAELDALRRVLAEIRPENLH